ncbi:MAG: hypothetical protein CL521_01765 [Actinobacteria bacterium]|nr:hypothetical protein [Actinomycetota bacterium]
MLVFSFMSQCLRTCGVFRLESYLSFKTGTEALKFTDQGLKLAHGVIWVFLAPKTMLLTPKHPLVFTKPI